MKGCFLTGFSGKQEFHTSIFIQRIFIQGRISVRRMTGLESVIYI